jgi:hypothetical protein
MDMNHLKIKSRRFHPPRIRNHRAKRIDLFFPAKNIPPYLFLLPLNLADKNNRPLTAHSPTTTTNCKMANFMEIPSTNEPIPNIMAATLVEMGKATDNTKKHVRMANFSSRMIFDPILFPIIQSKAPAVGR